MSFTKEELNGIENRKKVLEEKKKGELEEDFSKAIDSYSAIYRILGEIKEEEGEGDNSLFRLGDYVINELKGEGNELEEIDEKANELETKLEILEGSIKSLRSSISRLKNNGKIFSIYRRFEKELDRRS